MKKLSLILLGCMCCTVRAVTVDTIFPTIDARGKAQAAAVVVTPLGLPTVYGTNLAAGRVITLTVTNGVARGPMLPGRYRVTWDGLPGFLEGDIPETNIIWNFSQSVAVTPSVVNAAFYYTRKQVDAMMATNVPANVVTNGQAALNVGAVTATNFRGPGAAASFETLTVANGIAVEGGGYDSIDGNNNAHFEAVYSPSFYGNGAGLSNVVAGALAGALTNGVFSAPTNVFSGAVLGNGFGVTNTPGAERWSLALVHDPQNQISSYQTTRWLRTMEWLRTNAAIQFVVCDGDLVNAASEEGHWTLATNGWFTISNKPVILVPGNHDSTNLQGHDWGLYDLHVTRSFYTGNPYFHGDFFTNNSQANLYCTMTNGVQKTLLIGLECYPRTNVVMWASNLCRTFPDHAAWVVTHSFLNTNGMRTADGDLYGTAWIPMTNAASGANMWSMMKTWPNLAGVLCGHQLDPVCEAHSLAIGDAGNWVPQVYFNYQNIQDAGGYVSYVKVLERGNAAQKLSAKTFDAGNLIWQTTNEYVLPWGIAADLPIEQVSSVSTTTSYTVINTNGAGWLAPIDRGLVFRLMLDEGTGTNIVDSSPYQCPRAYADPALATNWLAISNSYCGRALNFFDGCLVYSNAAAMATIGSNMTISVWYRPTNAPLATEMWVARHYGAPNMEFFLGRGVSANVLDFSVYLNGGTRVDNYYGGTHPSNGWHHVVAQIDGTQSRLWLDGTNVQNVAAAGGIVPLANCPTKIGNVSTYTGTGGNPLRCGLDDLRIWNRTLSTNEIKYLYQGWW